jgi:hypothetical protein
MTTTAQMTDLSVADSINMALEICQGPDSELASTQEMPAVCNNEMGLATYYADEELMLRTWQHALMSLEQGQDVEGLE